MLTRPTCLTYPLSSLPTPLSLSATLTDAALPSLLESSIDPKSALQLMRLLGCVTVVCVEDRLLDALTNTAVAMTSTSPTVAAVTSSVLATSLTTPGILDPSFSGTMIVAEVPPLLVEDSVPDPQSIVPVPPSVYPPIKPSNTASTAFGKKAVSGFSSWDRPDLMRSLPWLQWRGVSIVPRGADSPPSATNCLVAASTSTSTSVLDTVPVSISGSEGSYPYPYHSPPPSGEMGAVSASLSCQLQFDDVEHTQHYRDEELEKELEVALSRRGSKGSTRAISKGSASAARDAPCILRRKVIPRTGPNRTQAVDRAQTGQVPQGLGSKDVPAGLHGGLASILAANREASEKRSYSMINRKASTRNQHSKKEGSSTLDSGEFNILRVRRNETAEIDKEKSKEKEESKISIIARSPIRASMPVMRSVFQTIGPEPGFNPSDFVAAAIPNGNAAKKTDFKTVKGGPGRIRGDWITALIAGGPPSGPGVKTATDPGSVIPKIGAAKSSSFRKKPSRDHNEDDFTAVEDVSGTNANTIPSSASKGIGASSGGGASQPVKAPMSVRVPSAPGVLNKLGLKLKAVNNNTTSISTTNVGETDVSRTSTKQDKLVRKREDSIDFPAPTLKKKRALDDVKAHFPALSSLDPTLTSTSSATSSSQDPAGSKSDMNLMSFKQWRINQDSKSNDLPNQEEKDKPSSLIHRAPSPPPSLRPPMGFMTSSTLPASLTPSLPPSSSKIPSVVKLPPTFKVVPRPAPPSAIRSSFIASSVAEERREKTGDLQDNTNRMDVVADSRISSKVSDRPAGGSGPKPPSADDFTVSMTSATPSASSTSNSTSTTTSNSSLKSPTKTDGVPTARTMHASITGGVIVSGTLQRAKPGPKPRLQFTSDGDNSTVRGVLYCADLGSVIQHLPPV
jgi:hypothetical protein